MAKTKARRLVVSFCRRGFISSSFMSMSGTVVEADLAEYLMSVIRSSKGPILVTGVHELVGEMPPVLDEEEDDAEQPIP